MSFSGNNYYLDRGPPMPDGMSEFQPIHTSGHIDIGKYHGDICSTFKYQNGFVRISRFDSDIPRIFYNLDGDQP
jgi:hypothetical protein